MSRARIHEVSSPISLFPFIGILLCTMGALLVVLVAVSRSARESAVREVQARQQSQPRSDATQKQLAEVNAYVGNLTTVRGKAEHRLHEEQARLSTVEDSIRRLHEKMDSLQAAAAALQAMEKEHYDDRKQAEREVVRLHQLIDESQTTVAAMREDVSKAPRSYAVVPYEGPNGTYRRPIYIECVKDGLILQPEAVHLTADDLRPPIGPGNPLATVLRAARDQIIRVNPAAGKSRDLQPYPLLLVRPEGLLVYDLARQAIEAGDFDLGFELVESDWKLKYPPADPQLADVEQQALVQARARQVLLAAAAPRAYSNAAATADAEYDDDGSAGGGGGFGEVGGANSGSGGNRYAEGTSTYIAHRGHPNDGAAASAADEPGTNSSGAVRSHESIAGAGRIAVPADGDSSPWSATGSKASGPIGPSGSAGDIASDIDGAPGQPGSARAGGSGISGSVGAAGASASSGGGSGSGGMPGGPPPDKNLVPDGYQSPEGGSMTVSTSPQPGLYQPNSPVSQREREQMKRIASRGKDWALREKPPRAVPVRRTIRVSVRQDQVVIMPGSVPAVGGAGGDVIPLHGDTVQSIDEFVKHVRDQIDAWGMAGNGLYWRPVVLLQVGSDGQQRADDLARLLKNSGLEIRTDQVANHSPQGSAHETR
ncbi:MAG TPA: hypothetical protein VFW73_01695 [Lacipirellulaceae bacterium]|nr:hypothetical protein [Lacipirellulaceae bacterium]